MSRSFGFVPNEIGDQGSDLLIMVGLVELTLRTGSATSPVYLTLT